MLPIILIATAYALRTEVCHFYHWSTVTAAVFRRSAMIEQTEAAALQACAHLQGEQ